MKDHTHVWRIAFTFNAVFRPCRGKGKTYDFGELANGKVELFKLVVADTAEKADKKAHKWLRREVRKGRAFVTDKNKRNREVIGIANVVSHWTHNYGEVLA